jgi:hypothetical protein
MSTAPLAELPQRSSSTYVVPLPRRPSRASTLPSSPVSCSHHLCIVLPHHRVTASNPDHQDHRVVTLLRCPSPASAPSSQLAPPLHRRPSSEAEQCRAAPPPVESALLHPPQAPGRHRAASRPARLLHRPPTGASTVVPLRPSLATVRSLISGEPPPCFRL